MDKQSITWVFSTDLKWVWRGFGEYRLWLSFLILPCYLRLFLAVSQSVLEWLVLGTCENYLNHVWEQFMSPSQDDVQMSYFWTFPVWRLFDTKLGILVATGPTCGHWCYFKAELSHLKIVTKAQSGQWCSNPSAEAAVCVCVHGGWFLKSLEKEARPCPCINTSKMVLSATYSI